jgi:hypothetical protein
MTLKMVWRASKLTTLESAAGENILKEVLFVAVLQDGTFSF